MIYIGDILEKSPEMNEEISAYEILVDQMIYRPNLENENER